MNHEPHGPEMWPSGWRLRKACVGRLRRERRPNLSEPAKCSQHLAGFRWCSVRSAVWQPAKRYEHLAGAVVRQTILVRHAIQSVDARRGGALEVKKTPAQCCVRLAGHEGAMFQRVRLAGPIPCQCPYYDCGRPPVVRMVRRGKAVASRFGGPPCSARDLPKRFWSYAGPFF